jgi:MED7 protein
VLTAACVCVALFSVFVTYIQGYYCTDDPAHYRSPPRKRRDELSHCTFLMLQECNKFREHQARELLIELLEEQLDQRRQVLAGLQVQIQKANAVLDN